MAKRKSSTKKESPAVTPEPVEIEQATRSTPPPPSKEEESPRDKAIRDLVVGLLNTFVSNRPVEFKAGPQNSAGEFKASLKESIAFFDEVLKSAGVK